MTAPATASGSVAIAQEELRDCWRTHRRWVAAILLAHKPREAELEDLLQEVAMRLVRESPNLTDPAAVRPWLRTVAVNVARTAGRRQTVRRRASPTEIARQSGRTGFAGAEPTAERDVDDARRALDAAIELPAAYREPLLLRAVRGMSYRQISDVLGLPITTIETRIVRARRMLREQLEDEA